MSYSGPLLGFLRADALEAIRDVDPDPNYTRMSNKRLTKEMCLMGLVHDAYMGGVFDELPPNMIDGYKLAETHTGWPPVPPGEE
jgi:hypothetical protein